MNPSGKTILITGSTDGVGRLTAERLAANGAEVIVHGRDRGRGEQVAEGIRRSGGRAEFYSADLASLAEVRGLAGALLERPGRLDVLVNNAGIGSGGPAAKREESADGFELRFAVNYLAGFLLTHLLMPKLKASAPARVVNVSSLGQQAIDFEDLMLRRGYSGGRAYCQSKLAQILFTVDLSEQLKDSGVTVNCLHPATYMNTTMVRQAGVRPTSTVESGCEAILDLVLAEDIGAGGFWNGTRPARADPQAYDSSARARLREVSLELTGLGTLPSRPDNPSLMTSTSSSRT